MMPFCLCNRMYYLKKALHIIVFLSATMKLLDILLVSKLPARIDIFCTESNAPLC